MLGLFTTSADTTTITLVEIEIDLRTRDHVPIHNAFWEWLYSIGTMHRVFGLELLTHNTIAQPRVIFQYKKKCGIILKYHSSGTLK